MFENITLTTPQYALQTYTNTSYKGGESNG